MSALAYLAVGAAALGVARWWYPRALERALAARFPRGEDGIIPAARPILREGTTGRGVLVLHGYGDTPQSVATLVQVLHAGGDTVHAPLLAGHGRTLEAFARSGANDWITSARDALRELRSRCPHVSIAGQSLGGVIATILTAESTDIAALALLAPYFEMPARTRSLAAFAAWAGGMVPYLFTTDHRSIHDPIERAKSLSFGATSPRLLHELMLASDRGRAALMAITVPTLYIQAKEDNRIAPDVAERSFESLGAREKRLIWLERGGHVVAADEAREDVARLVAEWFAAR